MAEGDVTFYNKAKEQLLLGGIDLVDDTLKLMLVVAHTPDIDADEGYADVSADEAGGTGYTAGGETVTSATVVQNNSTDRAVFDAADVPWTALYAFTPSHAILYDDTHASNVLICYWELGSATNNPNDYIVSFAFGGIFALT